MSASNSPTNSPTNSPSREDLGSNNDSNTDAPRHNQELDARAQVQNNQPPRTISTETLLAGLEALRVGLVELTRGIEEENEIHAQEQAEFQARLEAIQAGIAEDRIAEDRIAEEARAEEAEQWDPLEQNPEFPHMMNLAWNGRYTFVRVADLPEDERKCCICQLKYLDRRFDPLPVMGPPSSDDPDQGMCQPRRFSCGHVFGDRCINIWAADSIILMRDVTCPMCRAVIVPAWPVRTENLMEELD